MSTSFCAAEPVNAAETSSLEAYTQAVMSLWSEHLLCAAHCAKDIGPPSRRRQSDGRGRGGSLMGEADPVTRYWREGQTQHGTDLQRDGTNSGLGFER